MAIGHAFCINNVATAQTMVDKSTLQGYEVRQHDEYATWYDFTFSCQRTSLLWVSPPNPRPHADD
jgi:hypothetical protein